MRFFLTVMLIAVANPAAGQEAEHADEHSAEHDYHRNTIAGFVGITGENRRERALTLGLEYERRFSETFGVVVSVEQVLGDLDFTVLAVPFAFHRGPWTFSVGPGIEFPSDDGDDEFVARGSVLYSFEQNGYELAPRVTLDFVDGETVLIVGLIIGKGF